jgi:predicted transposase/invertase (TIGR01784 family)
MRRDSIFYQLFRQSPALLFELLLQPPARAREYIFEAIEIKETGFRIDGVFLPPEPSGIVYFCEIQFQLDELLYERMNSEIGIYIYRNREQLSNWQAVVIYPSRNIEQSRLDTVQEMLASGRIQRVYLDELGEIEELPIGLGLMVLTTLEGDKATAEARGLIERAEGSRDIIDLISTIMVYKFSNLSRDEVNAMLGIELKETRVYRDAKAEGERVGEVRGEARGEVKEAQSLIFRLLTRRVGKVSIEVETRIKSLPLARLEELHDAALDFTQIGDLTSWLDANG